MNGRKILLGVCGGIAAYKAAALASRLVQRGAELEVILTDEAQRFIGAATFAALSRRAVWTSLWERTEEIPHIRLVREADVLAIVPATANVIAKLAQGIADDLLTNAALAARIPIVVAPAMNDAMLEHPATRANLAALAARGVTIVEPGVGFLAEREHGPGRLADEDAIVAALETTLARTRGLAGERVLITAGPTREAIDPVRFLSNAATGTTGIELAREALARGAEVDLVLGPTHLEPPAAARVARVTTAREMEAAALARAPAATIVIATAAVADWRPAETLASKVKKTEAVTALELERNPDILAALGARRNGGMLVGFAAETDDHEANAREKLARKQLDAIVVNDVSGERGFGTGDNALVVLWGADGRRDLGRATKRELAIKLWDTLLEIRSTCHPEPKARDS
jgi:phosphopantothenoylcysteine decarboxylase/phosphopantothenate--cysteine ligase